MKIACVCTGLLVATTLNATTVEIAPQKFDAGGWSLDVQFADVMGSAYLLAHGKGLRVLDATAGAEVPEAGNWRRLLLQRRAVRRQGAQAAGTQRQGRLPAAG